MNEITEARPEHLDLVLVWEAEPGGRLAGQLRARNVSNRPVRLAHKPGLQVLGADGVPLEAKWIITLEYVSPRYADLDPGEAAVSRVDWAGWDGAPPSGEVVVHLPGGTSRVQASGPRQPESSGHATNLTSSWFVRTDIGGS
jgi:Protein of unknown function (DUF4232)